MHWYRSHVTETFALSTVKHWFYFWWLLSLVECTDSLEVPDFNICHMWASLKCTMIDSFDWSGRIVFFMALIHILSPFLVIPYRKLNVKTYTDSHTTKTCETNIVNVLGYCSSGNHNSSRISAYYTRNFISYLSLSSHPHSHPTLVQGWGISSLSFDLFSFHNVLCFADFSGILYLLKQKKKKDVFLDVFQNGSIPPRMC